ncbi:hypothetical protein ACROYT_G027015 [Oculina patagonica]
MGSRSIFFLTIKLITFVSLLTLCCIQGQKRNSSNQNRSGPLTTLVDQVISSTKQTKTELPQNNSELHGGIIALILLGCIVFVVLLGIFVIVVYLRKRNFEQYPLKWEKNFEESMGSFEMLECEMAERRLPIGRRGKKVEKVGIHLIHKRELESSV